MLDCKSKGRLRRATGDSHGTHTHPEKAGIHLRDWAKSHSKERVGEGNPSAKLTWDNVREIRKEYLFGNHPISASSLATRYGVTKGTILLIINNKTWVE